MQDEVDIQAVEHIPTFRWPRFLLESVLAIGGALVVTGLISLFHLYPQIPNISLVYLLVILLLASTFGRFAAVLASVTAFLAFDYFLVPPLYTFTIARWEEWIALFVFLVTALLTSQLAAVMRQRAAQARRQERETRILYELLRYANTHERLEELLSVVAFSTVRVFAPWGVSACALLLPDEQGTLTMLADTLPRHEPFTLSSDELALVTTTMTQDRIQEKRSAPPARRAGLRTPHQLLCYHWTGHHSSSHSIANRSAGVRRAVSAYSAPGTLVCRSCTHGERPGSSSVSCCLLLDLPGAGDFPH